MSKTKAILRRALSGCLLLLFTVNLSSQAPESGAGDARTEGISPNTAEAILDRALDRTTAQEESGAELTFEFALRSIVDSINGDGEVTDTKTTAYHGYPLEGHRFEELIARDGEPLDEGDARDEAKRKREFASEARVHTARGERYEPNEMAVRFDRQLMDRYEITLLGSETIRDHTCWVLAFEPRSGRLPDDRRMDKALNRSTGRLWISQDDYGVARIAFKMQRPFRYLWGLVATLRNAEGQLDFELIQPDIWAPSTFNLEMDLRVFFKGIRRRIQQHWSDYQPVDLAVQGEPIP